MTSTAIRAGAHRAVDASGGSAMPQRPGGADGPFAAYVSAIHRLAEVTPTRVASRYHYRLLTYRQLAQSLDLMVPVTRSQRMDDRAAVVAAVFAGIPSLSAERDPAAVASVIDGTFARVLADVAGLDDGQAAPPRQPLATSEIDLRGIASRLNDA